MHTQHTQPAQQDVAHTYALGVITELLDDSYPLSDPVRGVTGFGAGVLSNPAGRTRLVESTLALWLDQRGTRRYHRHEVDAAMSDTGEYGFPALLGRAIDAEEHRLRMRS